MTNDAYENCFSKLDVRAEREGLAGLTKQTFQALQFKVHAS